MYGVWFSKQSGKCRPPTNPRRHVFDLPHEWQVCGMEENKSDKMEYQIIYDIIEGIQLSFYLQHIQRLSSSNGAPSNKQANWPATQHNSHKLVFSDPDSKKHGAHLRPTGPRWAPCWPHEPCYLGDWCGRQVQYDKIPYLPLFHTTRSVINSCNCNTLFKIQTLCRCVQFSLKVGFILFLNSCPVMLLSALPKWNDFI